MNFFPWVISPTPMSTPIRTSIPTSIRTSMPTSIPAPKKCQCHPGLDKKPACTICLILDISASMRERFSEVIDSINQFVKIQQKEHKDDYVNFNMVIFGTNSRYYLKDIDLQKVEPFNSRSFVLESSTALFDTIGKLCEDLSGKNNITLCTITDGQDNASKHYSKESIKNILETKKKYNGWENVFLSSSMESFNENKYFNATANIQSSGDLFGYDIKNQMSSVVTEACNRQKMNYFGRV